MTDREAIVAALHRIHPATDPKDQYDPENGLAHSRMIEFLHRPYDKRYDDDGRCDIDAYFVPATPTLGAVCIHFSFGDSGALIKASFE